MMLQRDRLPKADGLHVHSRGPVTYRGAVSELSTMHLGRGYPPVRCRSADSGVPERVHQNLILLLFFCF